DVGTSVQSQSVVSAPHTSSRLTVNRQLSTVNQLKRPRASGVNCQLSTAQRQCHLRSHAAEIGVRQCELAFIKADEIRHDRKPEAASERAFIEAYAAIDRALRLFLRHSRSVVIDDDEKMSFVRAIAHADTAGRPFAGVLYEIAENLLEILAVGRIGRVGAHVVDDLELAIRVDACEPACDLGNDRSDRY